MRRFLFVITALLLAPPLAAHQIKSVVMNLEMLSAEHVQVAYKAPLGTDGRPSPVFPLLEPACEMQRDPQSSRSVGSVQRYWVWHCPGGLEGRRLELRGLNVTTPDGIVEFTDLDGIGRVHVLDRHSPEVIFGTVSSTRKPGLAGYVLIGMEHILLGADHLLFVFCLLFILGVSGAGVRRLLVTITAFTVAHSITLAMSVLQGWQLPPTPVEAVIALSILLLAVELARHSHAGIPDTLTFRHPETVAFVFGLLHGFGFAGALADIGLPEGARGWALLLFNLGVEAGQLFFIVTLLVLTAGLRYVLRVNPAQAVAPVITLVGAVSAYWFIDRLMPVFTG